MHARRGELTGRSVRLLVCALVLSALSAAAAPVSDVLKAPRPKGGEYFGLYLLNKKVGYIYEDLTLVPGAPDKAKSVLEIAFRATVGGQLSERFQRETRTYEAKPGGRLLSFLVEQKGDGGNQTLEATSTPVGLTVVRKRPGLPNQVLNLPPSKETIEDADQARVAILRNKVVDGENTDSQDLQNYRITTKVEKSEDRLVNGVKVHLHRVTTLSEKEKVPVVGYVTDAGDMVEIEFAQNMVARAESETVAKNLDKVEAFGLTRVVLPKSIPSPRAVPGQVTMVMTGLPDHFLRNTYRQHFRKLGDGKVEVKISATPPKDRHAKMPLKDPQGGINLKSSIIVESDNADIQATAKRIAGNEQDALVVARRIVQWVGQNMKKEYGASADRASDVLRQMKGDCTEHSLLSEALLRSLGIPARRVDGVVYVVQDDGVPALYWHEWVEAYVGEWTQLDPTFNQEVADATHFAVGQESDAEIVPLIGQMKVIDDAQTTVRPVAGP